MFIVYQIRSNLARTVHLTTTECPNCNAKEKLQMDIYQKYIWFLGPILPAGKTAFLDCNACEQTIPIKQWTKELDSIYRTEKKNTKTPFRYFRGFIILILIWVIPLTLIKFGVVVPNKTGKRMEESKAAQKSLKKGDLFFGMLLKNDGKYPECKVAKIIKTKGDSHAYIVLSKKTYGFNDGEDLEIDDFSDSDFVTEQIEVQLDGLRKNGAVTKNNGSMIAFMSCTYILK